MSRKARRATTFSFTCRINHLHNPHKIRRKCLKIRCYNLIIKSEETEVTRVLSPLSSRDAPYRDREGEDGVVLRMV